MKLLEGITLIELVMLLGGIVLFVTMVISLWKELPGKVPAPNWIGIAFSIAMIGWPTIQKISYENGKLTIEKYAQNPPQDSAQKTALARAVDKVESRGPRDPRQLALLARGRAALGEGEQAFALAAEAAHLPGADRDVETLTRRIGVQLIEQAFSAGGAPLLDPRVRANLDRATATLQNQRDLPPEDRIVLARGLAAQGRTRESVAAAQEAVRARPDLRNDPQVRLLLTGTTPP